MNGRIYLQEMSIPVKTEDAEKVFREMLKGSEEAFSTFFCRFYPGLIRYALTLLPYPTDEAEDMVSEVFCTMWKNRKQLNITGAVSSYLYVAVKHRIYDHIKKQKLTFEDIDDGNLGHPGPDYKVKTFGDVPWFSKALNPNDEQQLKKARVPRTLVMDSVLNDINYAVDNLGTGKSSDQITKWTALALKSRICLFEGTFRKYHTEFNLPNADKFLQEAAKASLQLMTDGPYHIYKRMPDKAYQELFIALTPITDEVILAQQYSAALQVYQNVNYYTLVPSQGKPGLEKDVINSYLMNDGSRFTDIPNYDKMQFFEEMQNRDPRLSQTVRAPGYTRIGSTVKRVPDFGATVTGYQPIKYITAELYDSSNKSINAIPVFRYAEALLNYAEAQAELNQLTQADLDKSINLIKDRVAMPHLNMVNANASPDLYLAKQYTQVSGGNKGVILEIRRERRLELVMENYRWDDLMRWKEGHLLARQYKGMYFPGLGNFDFDHNGIIDAVIYDGAKPTASGPQYFKINADIVLQNNTSGGPMLVNPQIPKTFNETRDYLYPIPVQEILLNPGLTQNPNWK